MKCVVVGVLVYYASRCIGRNKDWSTEERLYKAGLDVCPLNAKVGWSLNSLNRLVSMFWSVVKCDRLNKNESLVAQPTFQYRAVE